MDLMSVDEAIHQILAETSVVGVEKVALAESGGRILAEDVISDLDIPSQPLSSMDGFAVRAEDIHTASSECPVMLPVVMNITAGSATDQKLGRMEAARIMTGAPLPPGADTIVPVEDTDANWETEDSPGSQIRIFTAHHRGAFVRTVGEEIRLGEQVLTKGTSLTPAAVAVMATLGKPRPLVFKKTRVAIFSTGDELVSVDQSVGKGKIRESNSILLANLVKSNGGQPIRFPIARDDLNEIRALLWSVVANKPDLIISSAGVSVGATDYIRDVMEEMGQMKFWRVNMRPGKPLVFGHIQGIPYFGLPGNPVSTHITFDVFVRPYLLKISGAAARASQPMIPVRAGETFKSDGRQSYLRVKLKKEGQEWFAYSTGTQSSAALTSILRADGLLVIEAGQEEVPRDTPLRLRLLKQLSEIEATMSSS